MGADSRKEREEEAQLSKYPLLTYPLLSTPQLTPTFICFNAQACHDIQIITQSLQDVICDFPTPCFHKQLSMSLVRKISVQVSKNFPNLELKQVNLMWSNRVSLWTLADLGSITGVATDKLYN